jgi:hypothetical protein
MGPSVLFNFSILSFVMSMVMAGEGATENACKALLEALPSQIFFPDSTGYNASVYSYKYFQSRLRPTCIAAPNSSGDVAKMVKILGQHDSVNFAIRGGGHSINTGTSSAICRK